MKAYERNVNERNPMANNKKVTPEQLVDCVKQQAVKMAKKLNSDKDIIIKRKAAGEFKIQSFNFENMN